MYADTLSADVSKKVTWPFPCQVTIAQLIDRSMLLHHGARAKPECVRCVQVAVGLVTSHGARRLNCTVSIGPSPPCACSIVPPLRMRGLWLAVADCRARADGLVEEPLRMTRDGYDAIGRTNSAGRRGPQPSYRLHQRRRRWLSDKTAEQQMSFADTAKVSVRCTAQLNIHPGMGFAHRRTSRRARGIASGGLRCANRENQGG